MSNPLGARKQDQLMAMCTLPSINFTPVKYVMPLPYPVWRMLENSVNTAATSRLNEEDVYLLDQTVQPDCFGDFLGKGGGILSETVSDEVKPISSSDSVMVEGKYLIRKGDKCTLNKANTRGKYTTPAAVASGLAHGILGALSFIPGLGSVAAVADAILYAAEGDYVGAGLSLASAIPFCKIGVTAIKGLSKFGAGMKAALGGGRLGAAFTKGGAWIKGATRRLRPKSPCILGAGIQAGLIVAPIAMGIPVHAIRGAKILMDDDDLDYQGSGYLPFYLQRLYNSQNDNVGWFGQGWTAQGFEQRLEIQAQQDYIYLVDNSGRRVPFTYLTAGQSCYNPFEDITLYRLPHSEDEQALTLPSQPIEADAIRGSRIGAREPLRFMLINGKHKPKSADYSAYDGIVQHFSHISTLNSRGTKATVLPSKQVDRYGHTLQLHYSHHAHSTLAHLPQYITDANHNCYRLSFEFIDDKPRLTQLEQILTTGARLATADLSATTLATYTYDKAGDLIQVHRYNKLLRQFAYTNHLITWQQLPTGLEGHYIYDQTDQPKTARVIDHTLSSGQHYRFDYTDSKDSPDGLNHSTVTEQPDTELERQHHYRYDDWYILKSYTDPLGNTTNITHDHLDRPIRIQDPKGGHSLYHYHGSNLGSVSSKVGINPTTGLAEYRTTRYQYEGTQLVAVQNPLGHTERLSYTDDNGELDSYTDANGNSTRYAYDEHGNLIQETLANGSHFDYTFDDTGKLIVQSDCSGYQTHYNYDDKQRLGTIVDAKQQTTRYHYDDSKPWLHLVNHINVPDGSHISLVHDDAGRLINITDAKDQQTTYHYDKDNLPIQRIDALGHSLSYHYDSLRRLSTLTNENGENWSFSYDKGDNLISETRFDAHQSRYDYDPLGMLVTQIDNPQLPRHQQRHVRYQRDLIGQLIAKHSSHYANDKDNNNKKNTASKQAKPDYRRTRYQYNRAGQLISASNPNNRTDLQYDSIGQLISESTTSHLILNGSYQRQAQTLAHEYDEIGNRTATTLPDGKVINQLYYGSGHLVNQSLQDGENITEIRHSERNALHQEIVRHQGVLTSAYDHDPMGRLTKQYSSTDEHIAIERHYNYDVLGQLTHLTGNTRITHGQHSANPTSIQQRRGHQYQYDSIGRLTEHKRLNPQSSTLSSTEHFAFDPASNRVPVNSAQDKDTSGTNNQSNQSKTSKHSRPNSLTTHDKHITYTYDSHGRVLYKTQTPLGKDGQPLKQSGSAIVGFRNSLQLAYNADHELTQSIAIQQQGLELTEVTTTYHYDAFGRRIAKHSQTKDKTRRLKTNAVRILDKPIQPSKTKQHKVDYLWDGNRQLQETTATHQFTTIYEQDSFEPVARLVWLRAGLTIAANDEPTAKERRDTEGWYGNNKPVIKTGVQLYHYHNDHLGTPNELTDQQGEVVWYADYEAWGNTATVEWKEQRIDNIVVSEEHLQPIRFQGQSFDTETGLHYNRFRYFDPDLGMFTTRDPIGLMGGSNVFQYAPNPTGWIDPFGLSACTDVTPLPESGHLYRGVHAKHPALPDAKKGIARPARESGGASATEHNAGGISSNSSFTSWTDDINIARTHANKEGPGGVILSAPLGAPKAGEKWNFEFSEDVFRERERLINGTREGLGVHKP